MIKNKWLIMLLVFMLILPSFLINVAADPGEDDVEGGAAETVGPGDYAYKDEVVYANLRATGEIDDVYVVNIFEVINPGLIVDEGHYREVKNLTDLSQVENENGEVSIQAPKGKFYYQGNMTEPFVLPWDISISYFLNGEKIDPDELAGREGQVEIVLETSANDLVDSIFYESYLLQISLTLNTETFTNINAPDGMIANAGKNQQITFTVMPDNDAQFTVEADVTSFEFDGIEIAAVPASMSIDVPDTDEMTEDMESLTDAISQLNDGVRELSEGVTELNDGMTELRDGSAQFNDGFNELSQASPDLVDGSSQISEALNAIVTSLPDSLDDMDLSDLAELPSGLEEIAKGLNELSDGLSDLHSGFSQVYDILDQAILAIPDATIEEDEITSLLMKNMHDEESMQIIDELVKTFEAAQTAKGTYIQVKDAFNAVDLVLPDMVDGLNEMEAVLNNISSGLNESMGELDQLNALSQLKEGLSQLSSNYDEFHDGLREYTNGVDQLANNYGDLNSGISELAEGTNELDDGVKELHDGTEQLYDSTNDLPDQMQEEIDRMVSEFDKSDVDVISFVSPNNEKINSVQFVIKTDSIKIEEEVEEVIIEEEEKGFWQKLWDLFF